MRCASIRPASRNWRFSIPTARPARSAAISASSRAARRWLKEGELADRLLETRFGLHIVQVLRKIEGKPVPFEAVRSQIAENLARQSWQRAVHQYLQILVGRADIQGVTLEGADTPLVQ